MKKRLLIIYSLLLIFVIVAAFFAYTLTQISDEKEIRDYSQIKQEGILRVAIVQDSIYDEVGTKLNEKAYNFFRNFYSSDSLDIELHTFISKLDALKIGRAHV